MHCICGVLKSSVVQTTLEAASAQADSYRSQAQNPVLRVLVDNVTNPTDINLDVLHTVLSLILT